MTHEFATSAVISAAPAAVWRILTDAAGYASWNPEIVAIEGEFAADSRIKAHVRLGKGAVRAQRPSIARLAVGRAKALFTACDVEASTFR
jgi:uncharacterized protein YndB with AHSA1/START domain